MKEKNSFTLIELLVVISIIGLLSSIVLVNLKGTREKARIAKITEFSSQIYHALGSNAAGIWRFDEGGGNTAYDSSGYGNNGTINGASYVTGIIGNALDFNGSGYVNVGNPLSLQIANTVTIESWIYLKSDTGTVMAWFGNGYTQAGSIFIGTHQLVPGTWWFMLPGTTEWYCGNKVFNQWTHLVITLDLGLGSNQLKCYQNGVLSTQRNWVSDIMTRSSSRTIGYGSAGNYWNGLIDEVRIYSQALSAFEIQKHYAEGSVRHQNLAIK